MIDIVAVAVAAVLNAGFAIVPKEPEPPYECVRVEKGDGGAFHFLRKGDDPNVIIEPDSNEDYAAWLEWYNQYHSICEDKRPA